MENNFRVPLGDAIQRLKIAERQVKRIEDQSAKEAIAELIAAVADLRDAIAMLNPAIEEENE